MKLAVWTKVVANRLRSRVGFSLAFGLIWTSAARGDDPLFAAPVLYGEGHAPVSVAIGDLNGDKVLDLAVANAGSGSVSVRLGVGDGTFASRMNFATGGGPRSVAIGDLNGDLVPDLVAANEFNITVSVLLGVGDGTFADDVPAGTGELALSVAIGDLNGDLVPDLATTTSPFRSGNVTVLLGVGDGSFGAPVHYVVGGRPLSIAIGDFDGDQLPDLAATVQHYGFSEFVAVLLNQLPNDCNGNGIGDECDIDCGPPGGPCDFSGCGESEDCNGSAVPDDCEADLDGDGFIDDCDACPDSDLAKLITVEECSNGVTNELLDDGCTMNDVLTECSTGAHSHGELTACIARHANEWRRQGLLSGKDVGRIAHCAGTSNESRPTKRIKDDQLRGRR